MDSAYLVAGIYADREAALDAAKTVRAHRYPADRVWVLGPGDEPRVRGEPDDGRSSPALSGAAAGGLVGLLSGAVLGATVVLSAPVATALAGIGLGAAAGAALGQTSAHSMSGDEVGSAVAEALERDHWAVLVGARDALDADRARALIERTDAQATGERE